jgi:hypothetical protein
MPKWDWFDDFMIMKMMEEEEAEAAESENHSGGFSPVLFADDPEEEAADEDITDNDAAELLDALQEELSVLQDELLSVECNEPADSFSEAYTRWEARRDLLESQIFEVEVAIQDLEWIN